MTFPSVAALKDEFDQAMGQFVASRYISEDDDLQRACAYALQGKGKRVRPLLLVLSYLACGGKNRAIALEAAIAVEMVHVYSLVHDDMPLCDDDDLRRGRPTVHRIFDETTALLCGDALLSDAFAVLSDLPEVSAECKIATVRELSRAIGSQGMVLGQFIDLHQGSFDSGNSLQRMHHLKTGQLIAAACVLGGLTAGAGSREVEDLRTFGEKIGLAFQVVDDLLDGEETKQSGKTPGKDQAQNKKTFLSTMPYRQAQTYAEEITEEAVAAVQSLKAGCTLLAPFAESLVNRRF